MKTRKIVTTIAIAMVIFAMIAGVVSAKSLYVIADINDDPTPIQAYDIQGNDLVFQAEYNVPHHGWGAVGLGLDVDSDILFVTYEASNIIEKIDAKTMTSVGSTTVANANNIAGIVVDHDKDLVYAVDRTTQNLYIYDLNLVFQNAITLPTVASAYGIALDEINDLLYVTDYSGTVRYFDTAGWLEQGTISVSHNAIGIEVDNSRQIVYTVAGFSNSNLLSKYDLALATESTVDMGHGGMGLAVDEATGFAYVTGGYSGDNVSVWDPNTMTQLNTTGDIGDPTDVVVGAGYNPLDLTKTDNVNNCIDVGEEVIYTICYDNELNPHEVTNVTIVDTLPANATFISASSPPSGSYDPVAHTYTWNIGTLPAGEPESCVTLTVKVKTGAENTVLTNCCIIDSDQTGPSSVCEDTQVCSVVPTPTPQPATSVPTSTPYGIMVLMGLMMIVGIIVLRRKE